MKTVPNMKLDLEIGKKGENTILSYLSPDFVNTNSLKNDLINIKTNVKIEVKTESYTHKRIGIEQYSNKSIKSVGGPYKALRDGCSYIIHYFPKTNTVVIFNTEKLLNFLGSPEELDLRARGFNDCIPFNKKNIFSPSGQKLINPYITSGFAIPLILFPKESYTIKNLNEIKYLDDFLK